jgi:hypothetical protein
MPTTSNRRGIARWMLETTRAQAVYEVVASAVEGVAPAPSHVRVALQAPSGIWQRVLALEGCGAWLDNARRRTPALCTMVTPADALLRASSADALRAAVIAMSQLADIADAAAADDVRLLALKGTARLLAGEAAGTRWMSDIDLLADPNGARVIHQTLQSKLGYAPDEPGTPARHLAALTLTTGLPVEIHRRLVDAGSSPLEERVWLGAHPVPIGRAAIEIPDGTALLMHALEHAVVVHRTARFRLRDVVDVAAVSNDTVDWGEVQRYVDVHEDRRALQTLLAAAGCVSPDSLPQLALPITGLPEPHRAWRRIRRVGRTRLLAPAREDIPPASDPRVIILSQLAQCSPRGIARLALRAIATPARALQVVSGRWLPPEAQKGLVERDVVASSPRQ